MSFVGGLVPQVPVFIQNPTWAVENIVSFPVDRDAVNPAFVYLNVFQLIFRVTIQLEKLFVKKTKRSARSLERDQFQFFRRLERSLAKMGIDGKTCLLRAICDMQKRPLYQYSLIGEILTVLFTPKRGVNDFLHEYLEAESVGQTPGKSCRIKYANCPVSLFNLMNTYSTPDDKPVDHHHHSADPAILDDVHLAGNSSKLHSPSQHNFVDP